MTGMAELLLFNIDGEKQTAIRLTALRLGIPCRDIPPSMQGYTIEELLTGVTEPAALESAEPFTEELLLMHDLAQADFHELLDVLRREGQTVRLKAVVTGHNRRWTPLQLCRALQAEDEAMRRRAMQQRKQQHAKKHKKK